MCPRSSASSDPPTTGGGERRPAVTFEPKTGYLPPLPHLPAYPSLAAMMTPVVKRAVMTPVMVVVVGPDLRELPALYAAEPIPFAYIGVLRATGGLVSVRIAPRTVGLLESDRTEQNGTEVRERAHVERRASKSSHTFSPVKSRSVCVCVGTTAGVRRTDRGNCRLFLKPPPPISVANTKC